MNTASIHTGSSSTRRQFLKTAAASLAYATAPYVLGSDKAGSRPPIVGSGEHKYECIHDWGALPDGIVYGNTHGVAQDSEGFIYISHTVHESSPLDHTVVVFDREGRFVRSWGGAYKGGAHGLHHVVENGVEYFYICDTQRKLLVKTTLTGDLVWSRGCPYEESGLYKQPEEYIPTNVATAPDGRVFVSDGYGRNYVHVYRPDGSYVKSFGGSGRSAGRLWVPHGLMVDTRGDAPVLAIADRSNSRIAYYSLDGEHLSVVGGDLRRPCHFHERNGVLLIPDLQSRVTLFDRSNRLITHLGDGGTYEGLRDKARSAFTPGKFVAPHGAIFDRDGNIFVVEWVTVGRVTKLQRVT
jgi:hypothetical protein